MTAYEYKVIPAPRKGRKARGVKGAEAQFSNALEGVMNELALGGWEFQRAETLPSEERSGLTSTQTVFRSVLVFRRPAPGDLSDFAPQLIEDHSAAAPEEAPEQAPEEAAEEAPEIDAPDADWEEAPEEDHTRA